MPQITHVIWDLDGTLLDTEPSYLLAGKEIAQRYGRVLTPAIRSRMMGRPSIVAARVFLDELDIPLTPEAFIEAREELLVPLFRACQPMPGAVALTRYLSAQGIPQAIATSSTRRNMGLKVIEHGDWMTTFRAIVTSDDVEHGKPAPDIYLRAASLIDAPPESTLVFEDAPLGIDAALAAGMHVIATPEDAYRHLVGHAHVVIDSLEAFDPAPWGLPPLA